MRKIITLLFIFASYFVSFSQEIGEEIYQNQRCKVYAVEAGMTLYSLHKKYDVSIDEIMQFNPSVNGDLQIGQKIYIPIKNESTENNNAEVEYITHIVQKKETLYGISRTYNVTIDDLIKLNPEAEKGLSPGQILKIHTSQKDFIEKSEDFYEEEVEEEIIEGQLFPDVISDEFHGGTETEIADEHADTNYQIEIIDSIIEYSVQKGETIYTISRRFMVSIDTLTADNNIKNNKISPGQKLIIRLKKERLKKVEIREVPKDTIMTPAVKPVLIDEKDTYRILVALPLNLNKNGYILSGIYDENSGLDKYTEISVSFLMGAQMALDSLEKLGLTAIVDFFDTEANLELMKEHLDQNIWDVVFGPFAPELMEYTAEWGKNNKVPVVAVTNIYTKLLENNPYLISSIPSHLTKLEGLAKYFALMPNDKNVIIVEEDDSEIKNNVSYFMEKYKQNKREGNVIKRTTISGISGGTASTLIDKDKENYFIYLSGNNQQIMKFVNSLNAAKNTYSTFKNSKTIMVGLDEWTNFSVLNDFYKNRFELHFPANNYLNYNTPDVEYFVKKFREKYGSDPSRYAVHGFDAIFSQMLYLFFNKSKNKAYMNAFDLQSIAPQHGKENSAVFISKQKDFEIILLDIISKSNYFRK